MNACSLADSCKTRAPVNQFPYLVLLAFQFFVSPYRLSYSAFRSEQALWQEVIIYGVGVFNKNVYCIFLCLFLFKSKWGLFAYKVGKATRAVSYQLKPFKKELPFQPTASPCGLDPPTLEEKNSACLQGCQRKISRPLTLYAATRLPLILLLSWKRTLIINSSGISFSKEKQVSVDMRVSMLLFGSILLKEILVSSSLLCEKVYSMLTFFRPGNFLLSFLK